MVGILLLAWSSAVFGEPSNNKEWDRSLEDLTGNEVSTVSKIPQRASEALASVTVVTSEDIQKFGYRTLGEILQSISGVYLSDDRTYGLLGVRGLNVPGDFNGRTLVLIDGHRLNDPNYDYVPMLEDFPVDIRSIDRIEVIKGTSASVWGGNAIFATINVVTRSGRSVEGGRVATEYGTFARRKLFAEFGGITDSEIEYAVSAATVHSNGQRSVYIPEFDGMDSADGIFRGKDGMAAQRFTGRLSYQKVNFLINASSRTKSIPGASYGAEFDAPNTTTDDILNLEVNTQRTLSDHHSLLFRTYHDRQKYHQDTYFPKDDGPRRNWDSSTTGIVGSECRLIGDWVGRGRYIVGVEAQTAYRLNLANADLEPYELAYKLDGSG
jgi:iron complex outermembrane receptor protein